MSEYPSAAEVIAASLNTEIVGHSGDYNGGRLTYSRSLDLAIQGLDALREAGWAVEKLPDPGRDGCWRSANWDVLPPDGSTPAFDIGVDCSVMDADDVRAFALALLAAAVSRDGEK